MLIFRYLVKEVTLTLAALTSILMLIFLSNQFMLYLGRAANGNLPGMIVMKLLLLEMPTLFTVLLPLGFFMSLLLVYGRLYAESEMVVLQASGYGANQLLKHSLIMAFILSFILLVVVLWGAPWVGKERNKLMDATGVQILIQTLAPGRFQSVNGGSQVFYIESMNRSHEKASNIFWASQSVKDNRPQWDVLWAKNGFTQFDRKTREQYVVLEDGNEYQGFPGKSTYQTAHFHQYKARLPHPNVVFKEDTRSMETRKLLPLVNPDPHKAAEMQWRLSIAFMLFPLTLIAVPLSRVSPRAGKFAKIFPAIFIFFIYANLLITVRTWVHDGKISQGFGLWWVHALAIFLGVALLARNRKKLS